MKVLIANLGSTSFKYRLFNMADETVMARGGVERIGSMQSRSFATTPHGSLELVAPVPDHASAVTACLALLTDPTKGVLRDEAELAAIGFKAVHARGLTGVHRVTPAVLAAMEEYNAVCPAHNPPYVRAMRLLAEKLPGLPLVAAFETAFHQTIPAAHRHYAVPHAWANDHDIRRHGFHGASHRYIAERAAVLMGRSDAKVISCHLGGSSSLCALHAGRSVATSMGMSPQTGLPQNNRVGEFDPFALPVLMKRLGKTLDEVLQLLASASGLLGLSGVSNDLRDIESAASQGNPQARLALDVYVAAVRHDLGAYLLLLNGADAIVFTGGIGENSATVRAALCRDLDWFGIVLDPVRNAEAKGEVRVDGVTSRVQLWLMPTNEELIVARQTRDYLQTH